MVRPGVTAFVPPLARLAVPGRPFWCHGFEKRPEVFEAYLSNFARRRAETRLVVGKVDGLLHYCSV